MVHDTKQSGQLSYVCRDNISFLRGGAFLLANNDMIVPLYASQQMCLPQWDYVISLFSLNNLQLFYF